MLTRANDHLAVRVTDIERSTRFYVEAFGATILTNPFVLEGDFAEAMLEGPAGVRFKLRHLRFDSGVIELFQFIEPAHPAKPQHPTETAILHMGFQVDDVDGAAARVELAGGRLLMPVTAWGEWKLTFCADPDGNVIELADASIHDLIGPTLATFPEARP
jgi:glyoxylase I family protein